MQRLFFKSNVSLHTNHFDVWWSSLDKIQDLIKWTTFVDSITKGRARGRGPYIGADNALEMTFVLPSCSARLSFSPAISLASLAGGSGLTLSRAHFETSRS
jgi:hypothetical protein